MHCYFPFNGIDRIFRIEPKLSTNQTGFLIKLIINLIGKLKNVHFLMNQNIINQIVQDIQTKEDEDGKKTKSVTFCFDKNIIHSIYKCPSEYLSKKKRRQLSRKISSSIKGRYFDDQTSSDEETRNYSDLEEYEHFYSIIEWKNLSEESSLKMTPNNLNDVINSKNFNDFKDGNTQNPKSCLKQIKKLDILSQFDELKKQDQNDDLQTEISSQKNLNKENLQNDKYIIVSKFKEHQEEDEEEISINLDDLDEFQQIIRHFGFRLSEEKNRFQISIQDY
ncbi:unnamed protein product [Paramecium octaurelia]|uniref:Uncharacterized protein n=1 Tax=Paramecium octaurelia TaxID=43137 RepID=A0A8S1UQ53_PAROT|nr:unnamed protein product [Paramecium octaurelia]